MNSVHEPGSNGGSEQIPSRKTRSKTKPGARAPKLAQLARPGAHWHTQARTGTLRRAHGRASAVVSWPGPGRVVARDRSYRGRLSAVSWRVRAQAWPYRGRPRDTMPSRLATLVIIHYVYCDTNAQSSSLPQSQYTRVYCDTNLASFSLSHDNPECIAIHFAPVTNHSVTIQLLYHDTISYPSQASRLQHKRLYCNTVLQQSASACCNTI